jgi:hypothetical protein
MVDHVAGRIGSIEDIYGDDQSGMSEWALGQGRLVRHQFQLRAHRPSERGQRRRPGASEKQLVKDGPRIEIDQHLSEAEEQKLWRHYGLDDESGQPRRPAQPKPATTGPADAAKRR